MFKATYRLLHRHYHTRYHGIYKHAKKLFVFDLILLSFAVTLLGASLFFFFWKPTITDLIDINFSLSPNERLLSGNEITLTVEYKNRSKLYLETAVLAVHLPKGFVVDRAKTPESELSANNTRSLDRIAPGATGKVEINGVIFAEPNVDEKITAFLSYRPENKNSKEQKISASFLKTVGSTLSPEMRISPTALGGREIPVTLVLKNTGQTILQNISLKSDASYNFDKKDELAKLSLSPGETKAFVGTILTPKEPGNHKIQLYFDAIVNSATIRFQTLEKSINVIAPAVSAGLKYNFTKNYADGSDTVPVRIYWNNSGQYSLNNIRLRLSATPGVVDLKATAAENRLKIEGNDLIADKTTRVSLATGQPGSSDEFIVNLKLLPFFRSGDLGQLEVKITTEAELPEMTGQKFTSESAETIRLPLATQLNWQIRPVYYTEDGDQLGRGPLPPVVGETTKYWIFVEIQNSVNPIANSKLTAILGDGVEFTGKQSVSAGPELSYNKSSNTINWGQNSALESSNIGVYFEVAVKPTAEQLGKKLILVKSATFSADDDVTGKKLNLSYGALNNTLSNEDQGSAAGAEVVQ